MKPKNKVAANKISQGLTQLLLQEPFFGSLAMRLDFIEDETVQTECTNGKWVRYNPKFIEGLTHDQVKAEIIHEVQHCAKLHPFRRDGREMRTWNEATDYVINEELKSAGYRLDETWLLDAKFKGMSEEQVFTVLQQQKLQQNQGKDKANVHGLVEDAQGTDAAGLAEQEQNWTQAILQAAQQAKQYGELPAFVEAMVDEIKNPPVDTKALLHKFIEQTARNDFTWSRPNRRYLGQGLYLPSIKSEKLPPIVVYWDTSGSRWSKEQINFANDIVASAIMDARPERTHVVYGDTQVTNVEVFEQGDVVKFSPKGGGGTNFEPIFKYIEEQQIEPCCFVGITDLEGSFPEVVPEYPVIWLCDVRGNSAPFGEVVEVVVK